jgi:hypothetical protein
MLRRLALRLIALPLVKHRAAAILTGKSSFLIQNQSTEQPSPANRRA